MPAPRCLTVIFALTFLLSAIRPLPASAQVLIKVNENVNFRLGALGQFQGDCSGPVQDDTRRNLFIARLLLFACKPQEVTFSSHRRREPREGAASGNNISPQMG